MEEGHYRDITLMDIGLVFVWKWFQLWSSHPQNAPEQSMHVVHPNWYLVFHGKFYRSPTETSRTIQKKKKTLVSIAWEAIDTFVPALTADPISRQQRAALPFSFGPRWWLLTSTGTLTDSASSCMWCLHLLPEPSISPVFRQNFYKSNVVCCNVD